VDRSVSVHVIELTDAHEALERARVFLTARPVEHNLLLTILDQSIAHALGGTFWIVEDQQEIIGFALESPPGFGAVLAPMPVPACRLLAESITNPLPHVVGEAGAAAAFAGHWTECHSTSVTDIEGQRLYALEDLKSVARASGSLRLAGPADRATLVTWTHAFLEEADVVPQDAGAVVDDRLAGERFWVWDDGDVVSMASASAPVAGVARVQYVYTPPERRGAGYATACVGQTSRLLTDRGLRCVLFTDLENATSNAIYRRIGYEVVAEILGYGFA
jgi:ribosomal protein S18 acetylase RimI-like enzyme